jgi:ADP-dependent NAD(P)H-hydrate dehydratase / NAD(P)H-hydrate epimerase
MRYVVTPTEMAALDSFTINTVGVPGAVLMERAALAVAGQVVRRYPGVPVLVACGPGNNGGDGLTAARILHLQGVQVCCFAPRMEYKGDALINLNAARNAGVRLLCSMQEFQAAPVQAGVIVDALFGTGLKNEISGQWAEIIASFNASGKPVVAVDIPSGIDGETGRIRGSAAKANCTVTFQYMKTGHCLYPGREHTGELVIADIGIAENKGLFMPRRVLETGDAAYPERKKNSHKGCYGHVAVIAGSLGMLGAGALASRAAMRGGAGLVTWVLPQSLAIAASSLVTEAMILPVPDEGGRLTAQKSESAVLEALKSKSAAVVGPGLSRNLNTVELIRNILHKIDIPIVVDADGLFAVSGYPEVFLSGQRVLTPHPGEMARLMGCAIADVEADPLGAVQRCSAQYGGAAVLKGSTTLIASGDDTAINLTGNPGMATGGSGDVLAGLTGALLAQGFSAYDAACRACRLHGLAGDIAAGMKGQAGLVAGDIVESLPGAAEGERQFLT